MHVPSSIMISPPKALESEIGDILAGCEGLFTGDDDLMLTVFVLHQRHLGSKSLWAPYLAALPTPTSILNWTQQQLLQLQDTHLVAKARAREAAMRSKHARTVAALDRFFPGRLPREAISYPAFRWAWMTVQARAFGRRLPWTALVPFADNLNHSNTPVKYDFDVGGNGAFRLFSSGGSTTAASAEVFNSYGRRSNQHLALEYGFTMPNNEWCHTSVQLRKGGLHHAGLLHISRAQLPMDGVFRCWWNKWNLDVIHFLRICQSTEQQLTHASPAELLEASYDWDREVNVLQMAVNIFAAALAAFPTTLQEDLAACKQQGVEFSAAYDPGVLQAALASADAASGSDALLAPTSASNAAIEDIAASLAAMVAEGQQGATPGSVDDVLAGAEEMQGARSMTALVHRTSTKLILAQQCAWAYCAGMTARMAKASVATGVGSGKLNIPRGSAPMQWAQGVLPAAEERSSAAATDPNPAMAPHAAANGPSCAPGEAKAQTGAAQ